MVTLYQIESTWVFFAIYHENHLYLILKNNIYCYFDVNYSDFEVFLSQYSRGKYLNNHKSSIFSNYDYIYCLNSEKLADLYDFLPKYGLKVGRKKYKSTIEFIEDCTNLEITEYKFVARENN